MIISKYYPLFFNPNSEQHCENGYILLEENIRHLKNFLHSERTNTRMLDLSEFLDVSSIVSICSLNLKGKSYSDDKFACYDEDFNNFTYIENYFM